MNYYIVAAADSGLLTAVYVGIANTGYTPRQFLRGDDGEPLRFESEDAAIDYLNEHFRLECIYPDDRRLTPKQVAHMRREREG